MTHEVLFVVILAALGIIGAIALAEFPDFLDRREERAEAKREKQRPAEPLPPPVVMELQWTAERREAMRRLRARYPQRVGFTSSEIEQEVQVLRRSR